MSGEPYEGFYFFHLLGLSLFLLANFYWRSSLGHRSAWYFALAAPGALALPYMTYAYFAYTEQSVGLTIALIPAAIVFSVVFFPAIWIWSLVALWQLRRMLSNRVKHIGLFTWVCCTILVLLYGYTDVVYALFKADYAKFNMN